MVSCQVARYQSVGEHSSGMKDEIWPLAGKTFLGFAFVAGVVTWLEESEPATAGKGTKPLVRWLWSA